MTEQFLWLNPQLPGQGLHMLCDHIEIVCFKDFSVFFTVKNKVIDTNQLSIQIFHAALAGNIINLNQKLELTFGRDFYNLPQKQQNCPCSISQMAVCAVEFDRNFPQVFRCILQGDISHLYKIVHPLNHTIKR